MITTRNKRPYDGGIQRITGRVASLVQGLEKCPLQFTLKALTIFDKQNSPNAKKPSARRWIRQFCGFESKDSSKYMEPIIDVLNDGQVVKDKARLNELMQDMPYVA